MHTDRRGHYDRTKSKRTRRRETRQRIIAAAAEAIRTAPDEAPSVSRITSLAGVGRNTFYALFRDVHDVHQTAARRAAAELGRHLDHHLKQANTPIERLRALAHAWTESARTGGMPVGAAPCPPGTPREPPLVKHLQLRLATVLAAARQHGIVAAMITERRLAMVAAGWLIVFQELQATQRATPDAARELVDFTLRAFR